MVYLPRARTILRPRPLDNDNSLVGWWTFDDGRANDTSGGNNHGVLNNAPGFTDGIVPGLDCPPGALKFNGTTQYINAVSFSFTLLKTTAATISAWVNTSAAAQQTVTSNWEVNVNPGWQFALNSSGQAVFSTLNATASSFRQVRGGTSVNGGKWRLITCTYDGSNTAAGIKIYIDGSIDSLTTLSDTDPGTLVNSVNIFQIARRADGANPFLFSGSLDDIRIYNRALSGAEVSALYNSAFMPRMENEMSILQAAAAGGFFSRYYYDMPAGNRLVA